MCFYDYWSLIILSKMFDEGAAVMSLDAALWLGYGEVGMSCFVI